MSRYRFNSSMRSAVGVATLVLAAVGAEAALVNNNLSGNVEYNGWDSLGSGTPGLTVTVLSTAPGFGSNEAGSGDANLLRTSGFHYPAGASLYAFSGHSTFNVADTTLSSDVETVVLSILTWRNGTTGTYADSVTAAPTLDFNGGSQALPFDYVHSEVFGIIDFGGPVATYVDTYQWDLSDEGDDILSYDISWGQKVHAGLLALQLESADTFTLSPAAVPEPSTIALASLAGIGLLVTRRRMSAAC